MAVKDNPKNKEASTEEKIKRAARSVFHKKGYAATRTRDIAEEAGINLALLNYYFRSKAKLFDIIMVETLTHFSQHLLAVLNDEGTTLDTKVELLVERYIELLSTEPEIPLFILGEMRTDPDGLVGKLPIAQSIMSTVFFRQHREAVENGQITEPDPSHFLLNLVGLVVFPFISGPMIRKIRGYDRAQFDILMQERKKRIPVWVKAMMQAELPSPRN